MYGRSIEITDSTERTISIAWAFSVQNVESLIITEPSEYEPLITNAEIKACTLWKLKPGTSYRISIFPLSKGTIDSNSPMESLTPIGDPLFLEAMTLPGDLELFIEWIDEDSISGQFITEGHLLNAEIYILDSYHEPLIDATDGKIKWKFDNLLSGCQFTIQGIHGKNGTSRNTTVNATTLPKAPFPVDQIFDEVNSMITVVLENSMLMSSFEIFVKYPNYEQISDPLRITPRYSFNAHFSMLGYEIRTRSLSGDTTGEWFTFYIGISLVRDIKIIHHNINSVTSTWKLTPGKITHLAFSYRISTDSYIENYTSDEVFCEAELLECNISLLLLPGTFPTFSITPFLEDPYVLGKTEFYSFFVPLTVNSSNSSSDYADGISTITVTAMFYGYFEKTVSEVKQLGIITPDTENGKTEKLNIDDMFAAFSKKTFRCFET